METVDILSSIWESVDSQLVRIIKNPIKGSFNYTCSCKIPSIYETNECILCDTCGQVLDRTLISFSKEFSTFNTEDGVSKNGIERCGGSYDSLIPKKSMSSMISGNSKLAKINLWMSYDYKEQVLVNLKYKLIDICNILRITQTIVRDTLESYKLFTEYRDSNGKAEIHRGKSRDSLIATFLFYNCKKANINILNSTVISVFEITKKHFTKANEIYFKTIGSCVSLKTETKNTDILYRICCELDITYKYQIVTKKIITVSELLGFNKDHVPQSLASAALYFVMKELKSPLSVEDLSLVSDTGEGTIKRIERILRKNKILIFNYIKYKL